MLWKGKLAVFEGSNISETRVATPTKIGVHAYDVDPYLHKFFELISQRSHATKPGTLIVHANAYNDAKNILSWFKRQVYVHQISFTIVEDCTRTTIITNNNKTNKTTKNKKKTQSKSDNQQFITKQSILTITKCIK